MRRVIMMCGVCGSGKTTYAKKMETEGYVRLSIDEEMWKTYGRRGVDYPDKEYDLLSEKAEERLCRRLISLLQEGKDVVLDFSFWKKESRDQYRKIITAMGGSVQIVYMKADKELLRRRLKIRNRSVNADSPFVITEEILDHHYHCFQEPTEEENAKIIEQDGV